MPFAVDETHDASRLSWVESANLTDSEFPLQNLPFGRFRRPGQGPWQIGVAIGDQVLALVPAGLLTSNDMKALLTLSLSDRVALRRAIFNGLLQGSPQADTWRACLSPIESVELGLPCEIRDYSDFYVGIHHATATGRLFRPETPLLPNYKWVPIAYHGRASTIRVSGQNFRRPWGQLRRAQAITLAPTQRLDYELEMGLVVGRPNPSQRPISIVEAPDHLFGLTLLNDWSARDIQAWEYQPLGPFLGKSFASTLSPWLVTAEALAPFACPYRRPADDPAVLGYLHAEQNEATGLYQIALRAMLQSALMRDQGLAPIAICESEFAQAAYWTPAQMLTHQTVNGCDLNPGDLLGTGTLSGPQAHQAASLLEQTEGGQKPFELPTGEQRTFLQDGDRVVLQALAHAPGFRSIGFGGCEATVLPALPTVV